MNPGKVFHMSLKVEIYDIEEAYKVIQQLR